MKLCVPRSHFMPVIAGPVPGSLHYGLGLKGVGYASRMMSDWKVDLVNDNVNELYVVFKGPKDSAPACGPRPKQLVDTVLSDPCLACLRKPR